MHTVLMAAALVMGSGDGRDGAFTDLVVDDRSAVPLKVGMNYAALFHALKADWELSDYYNRHLLFEALKPDYLGRLRRLTVYDGGLGIGRWQIEFVPFPREEK